MKTLIPAEIVKELDRYIIGQDDAKRAVAIALRNRWRRQQLPPELREEVAPKNIIMIGPTGVGKTEIARRLARLANAPFVKVEAMKFTEVGYIGKDVESMIRDLVDLAIKMVREEEREQIEKKAQELARERVLDLLVPPHGRKPANLEIVFSEGGTRKEESPPTDKPAENANETREKFRKLLKAGKLNDRMLELEVTVQASPMVGVIGSGNMEEMGLNIREMLGGMLPKNKKNRKVTVEQAIEILAEEEAHKLIDMDDVVKKGIERTEQNGIVFLDEIDKIATRHSKGHGPDVSREGVQRDILPIVEGCSVNTKYGMVKTDHVLFVAAGAFHHSKPSDLMPELQGRFPIRVELSSLSKEDFLTILQEPQNSLTRQYSALLQAEGIDLQFTPDALEEMANFAALVNEQTENIGARRLHTIMETVLEEISFDAPTRKEKAIKIDAAYVRERLKDIAKDADLSRYIL